MKFASRVTAAVMGAWMGAAGIEHGIGELLQGNIAPDGIMIRSWPDAAFFHSLNGEPALTIVPNLFLTGILALLVSALFVGWSIFRVQHPYGGLGMALLAIPMLLFGGGIFPPVIGFGVGIAAQILSAPSPAPASGWRRRLGQGWPWIFAANCAAWLLLFPGMAVLGYFFGVENTDLLLVCMAAAFVLLPLSFWSSRQRD